MLTGFAPPPVQPATTRAPLGVQRIIDTANQATDAQREWLHYRWLASTLEPPQRNPGHLITAGRWYNDPRFADALAAQDAVWRHTRRPDEWWGACRAAQVAGFTVAAGDLLSPGERAMLLSPWAGVFPCDDITAAARRVAGLAGAAGLDPGIGVTRLQLAVIAAARAWAAARDADAGGCGTSGDLIRAVHALNTVEGS